MSAINSSVELFTNICKLAENRIDEHLENNSTDKSRSEILRISTLSEEIAAELNTKHSYCLQSILLYLDNREDVELRPGKNGGIHKVGDEFSSEAMTPKECALKNYESVKTCSVKVIDESFDKAEARATANGLSKKVRLHFQDLSREVADKLNIKSYAAYHCLKTYIEDERPDLKIEKGRSGGLVKI